MNAIDKAIEHLNTAIDTQGKDRLDAIHKARNLLKTSDTICISRAELEAMRKEEYRGIADGDLEDNIIWNQCIDKILER